MRNKIAIALFMVTLWTLAGVSARAYAASGDADGTYSVTITKVEMSKDSGATFTTVFTGSQVINIAAANAGAIAAGLVSGVELDPGTYDTVRVTIGPNLLLKAFINNSGTTIYTDGGTSFANNAGGGNDSPGSDYGISTFTIPAGQRTQTNNSLSIVVGKGIANTITVTFDVSGVLTLPGPSVGNPSVTIAKKS